MMKLSERMKISLCTPESYLDFRQKRLLSEWIDGVDQLEDDNATFKRWIRLSYKMLPDHIVFIDQKGDDHPIRKAWEDLPSDLKVDLLTEEEHLDD